MSTEPEKQEPGHLQHAAEHERPPHKHNSVLFYLVILFAAAFLLLLMSFLMQQRTNQEALDNLQETSNSAVESLENKLKENETLKQENQELKDQLADLQEQVDTLDQTNEQLSDELENSSLAMQWFWQIDDYYARGYYTRARELIETFEEQGLQQYLPTENTTGTDRFSPAQRYEEIKEALD